jgi:hypothetical protein
MACVEKAVKFGLVVIEASGVTDIDYTGANVLRQVMETLRAKGIQVALARLSAERAHEHAARTGLLEVFGTDWVFRSVEDAVRSFNASPVDLRRPARAAWLAMTNPDSGIVIHGRPFDDAWSRQRLTPIEHTITLRGGHIHRQGLAAARYPIYSGQCRRLPVQRSRPAQKGQNGQVDPS